MSNSELAVSYASLILADDDLDVTVSVGLLQRRLCLEDTYTTL